MRLMGIREAIEQSKDFLTEWGDEEEASKSGRGWRNSIAVTTAVIAVLGAAVGLFETNQVAEMIIAKDEALLKESLASDQWGYYQAKDTRRHLYEISARTNPALASEFGGKSKQYDKERMAIMQEARRLEAKSHECDVKSKQHHNLHLISAMSVTAIQISIALLAVSAYTRSKPLWLVAILISVVGFGCFGFGLLHYHLAWVKVPFFL
jgi:hypothetical protein